MTPDERARRVHDITYSTADRAELAERMVELEELVWYMWHEGAFEPGACYVIAAERLKERTRELGIEVES